MHRISRITGLVAVGVAAVALAAPAAAQDVDLAETEVWFEVTQSGLTITAPSTAELTVNRDGARGRIGTVNVTDARPTTYKHTVEVSHTGFSGPNGATISPADVEFLAAEAVNIHFQTGGDGSATEGDSDIPGNSSFNPEFIVPLAKILATGEIGRYTMPVTFSVY